MITAQRLGDSPLEHKQIHGRENTPIRAYFVILLAIVATSSAAIFIRYALDENMPPVLIAGARLAVATVALTPLALKRYRTQMKAG